MAGIVNHYQQKNMRAKKYCDILAKHVCETVDGKDIEKHVEKARYWMIAIMGQKYGMTLRKLSVLEIAIWFQSQGSAGTGNTIAKKLVAYYYNKHPDSIDTV